MQSFHFGVVAASVDVVELDYQREKLKMFNYNYLNEMPSIAVVIIDQNLLFTYYY
jgi:hypothetical protein